MKTTLKLFTLLFVLTAFVACSDDDEGPVLIAVESNRASNIPAPQNGGFGQGEISGDFTKFSFATGAVTDSETEWDIAFRGLRIAVNGGTPTGTNDEPVRNGNAAAAIVVDTTFAEVTSADGLTFEQDATGAFAIPAGSDNGWYNYNGMINVVTPLAGRILVFRTHDGKYAKVEILSYYRDAPSEITPEVATNDFRFYTFNYVYNPNEGETSLTQ
ncbi:MAG: HmuY family protein [Bacteroidota bacterium]